MFATLTQKARTNRQSALAALANRRAAQEKCEEETFRPSLQLAVSNDASFARIEKPVFIRASAWQRAA